MIGSFYRHTVLPRLCFVPYFVAKALLSVLSVIYRFSRSPRLRVVDTHLCIEAGVRGWESIEFSELYQSACEYLSPQYVHRLVVQPDQGYLEQMANLLQSEPITHYLYDPRTHNSSMIYWRALWESFRVAILFTKYGVVPIVLLTDLPIRAWRSQAAVVSARKGIVVCFTAPKRAGSIFPHRRLLGPSLMPFSVHRLQMLNGLIAQRESNMPPIARFIGSLYEPRVTTLEAIRAGLATVGIRFDVRGRALGSARVSDADYWKILCNADIVLTTADQAIESERDFNHIPNLVYRYLEVLASGSLLVAQEVPSVQRYFTPGVHFISFDTTESAVSAISHFLGDMSERSRIAKQGKERADALINARSFWVQIDSMLNEDSLC